MSITCYLQVLRGPTKSMNHHKDPHYIIRVYPPSWGLILASVENLILCDFHVIHVACSVTMRPGFPHVSAESSWVISGASYSPCSYISLVNVIINNSPHNSLYILLTSNNNYRHSVMYVLPYVPDEFTYEPCESLRASCGNMGLMWPPPFSRCSPTIITNTIERDSVIKRNMWHNQRWRWPGKKNAVRTSCRYL